MLYFKVLETPGEFAVCNISDQYQRTGVAEADGFSWINRNDLKTMAAAQALAEACNHDGGHEGGMLVATDSGPGVSPRYDVIRLPTVGDEVSYSFNSDSYPDGKVVSISKSLRVVRTDKGSAYYRRGLSGAWVKDGTWSLVHGHINKRNPSF